MPHKSLVFKFSERPYLGFIRSEHLIGDQFKLLKRFRHFQSLIYCHTKAISFSDLDNDFDFVKHYQEIQLFCYSGKYRIKPTDMTEEEYIQFKIKYEDLYKIGFMYGSKVLSQFMNLQSIELHLGLGGFNYLNFTYLHCLKKVILNLSCN